MPYVLLFFSFHLVQIGSLDDPVFTHCPFSEGDFQDISSFGNAQPSIEQKEKLFEEEESDVSASTKGRLFSCPVEGCVYTFQRHSNLERHLHYDKCKYLEEKHTLLDKAKIRYFEKLEEGTSTQPLIPGSVVEEKRGQLLPQGWALRSAKKSPRFSSKQKSYLDEKFRIGEETGNKADPEQVAKDMRHAKEEDGSRKFTSAEFLSPQQIKSYFSRASAKLRQSGIPDDDDESDAQAAAEQDEYSAVRAHII